MGAASEAFRLIETGGNPRLHPDLDYTLYLPLLISRYSLEYIPFLVRYPQTWIATRYRDLDYRLIQRQVKEELQLEKQNIQRSTSNSTLSLFETGTDEDRARIVLIELAKLDWESSEQSFTNGNKQIERQASALFDSPIYRQEVSMILAMCTLRCRHPLLNIQATVNSLRLLQNPAPLITTLVANHPSSFSLIIESLLGSEGRLSNTKPILLRLCKLADHKIWGVRQRLITRKVFPNLAIELTIEHCHDEICFMNRILRGQPEWLTNDVDPITRNSLSSIMEFVFSSLNDELTSERPDHVAVNRLLRILSGMVGLMNLSLTAEQLEISMGILEMSPLESSTIGLKICLILMSASQLLKYSQSRLERVLHQMIRCQDSTQIQHLLIYFQQQQLLRIDDMVSKTLSMSIVVPRGGLMELSTLFSHVFTNEELSSCALRIGRPTVSSGAGAGADNASNAANADATVLGTKESTIKSTINSISTHTPNPDSEQDSSLRSTANFIVGYLLQQDVFHKSATDVQKWVMEQIQAATVPLDANMIHLLRAYTAAISRSPHITRIPEQDIRACFSNPYDDPTPAKVLIVLYMLMNNDLCIGNLGSIGAIGRMKEYDANLLEYVQIRKIVLYVQNFQGGTAFRAVQPMFLKLVNSQFPELFDVTTLLLEEGMATSTQHHVEGSYSEPRQNPLETVDAAQIMEPHFQAIAQHIRDPRAAVKGYHSFQRLRQSDRQMLAEQLIKVSLPSLLDPKSSPPVIEAFKNTWDQLNSIMPHEIWALTIHALLPQPLMNPRSIITPTSTSTSISISTESATGRPLPLSHQIVKRNQAQKQLTVLYTFDWLVQDPLLLFKVDFRTFRSPMIFRLFIQVLSAVMTGSRHWYRKQLQIAQAYPQAPQQGRHPSVSGSSSSSSASAAAAASASNPASLVQAQRRQFKEANLSAMLYIQDSALVQLLLEICEARPEDLVSSSTSSSMEEGTGTQQQQQQQQQQPRMTRKNQKESSMDDISNVLKEVRIVTFNFLHQLFIDHKIFPKLVHFQGYAMDLLPAVVAGVDSIHVCLDFLQEILFSVAPSSMLAMSSSATSTTPSSSSSSSSHLGGGGGSGGIGGGGGGGGGGGIDLPEDKPDVAPQVFALRLAAHLCERFPLQNTMQMTIDFILPRFQALAISTGFAKEVLESAVILAKAFPSLRDDIVSVLRETSGPQDKKALERTIEAIHQELLDPAILDKSLL